MKTNKKNPAKKITSASNADTKLIRDWKRLHQQKAVIEPQIDQKRAALLAVCKRDGATALASRLGLIEVQTKTSLDVAELRRMLVDGGYIEPEDLDRLVSKCMRTSNPFLVAPREWGAELKTAAEMEKAA